MAGIITGAGGNFCAGMDLTGSLAGERPSVEAGVSPGSWERPPASRSSRRSRGSPSLAGSRSSSRATSSPQQRVRSSGCLRSNEGFWPVVAASLGCPSGCLWRWRWSGRSPVTCSAEVAQAAGVVNRVTAFGGARGRDGPRPNDSPETVPSRSSRPSGSSPNRAIGPEPRRSRAGTRSTNLCAPQKMPKRERAPSSRSARRSGADGERAGAHPKPDGIRLRRHHGNGLPAAGWAPTRENMRMADVEVEQRGPVQWILINRPDRRNAYDLDMARTMIGAIEDAAEMDAVVIRARPGRSVLVRPSRISATRTPRSCASCSSPPFGSSTRSGRARVPSSRPWTVRPRGVATSSSSPATSRSRPGGRHSGRPGRRPGVGSRARGD